MEYQHRAYTDATINASTPSPTILSSSQDKNLTSQSIKVIVANYDGGNTAVSNSTTQLAPLSSNATAELDTAWWDQCNVFTLTQ